MTYSHINLNPTTVFNKFWFQEQFGKARKGTIPSPKDNDCFIVENDDKCRRPMTRSVSSKLNKSTHREGFKYKSDLERDLEEKKEEIEQLKKGTFLPSMLSFNM